VSCGFQTDPEIDVCVRRWWNWWQEWGRRYLSISQRPCQQRHLLQCRLRQTLVLPVRRQWRRCTVRRRSTLLASRFLCTYTSKCCQIWWYSVPGDMVAVVSVLIRVSLNTILLYECYFCYSWNSHFSVEFLIFFCKFGYRLKVQICLQWFHFLLCAFVLQYLFLCMWTLCISCSDLTLLVG